MKTQDLYRMKNLRFSNNASEYVLSASHDAIYELIDIMRMNGVVR